MNRPMAVLLALGVLSCTAKAPQQDQQTGEVVVPTPSVELSDPYQLPPAPPAEAPQALRLETIRFTPLQHNIRDDQVAFLDRLADYLLQTRQAVVITGSADQPLLAERRARAVYDYLVRQGCPGDILLTRAARASTNTARIAYK